MHYSYTFLNPITISISISAKMLIYIHNKSLRRIFEAAAISPFNFLNTRPGFYNISPYLSKSILNSYSIFHI